MLADAGARPAGVVARLCESAAPDDAAADDAVPDEAAPEVGAPDGDVLGDFVDDAPGDFETVGVVLGEDVTAVGVLVGVLDALAGVLLGVGVRSGVGAE